MNSPDHHHLYRQGGNRRKTWMLLSSWLSSWLSSCEHLRAPMWARSSASVPRKLTQASSKNRGYLIILLIILSIIKLSGIAFIIFSGHRPDYRWILLDHCSVDPTLSLQVNLIDIAIPSKTSSCYWTWRIVSEGCSSIVSILVAVWTLTWLQCVLENLSKYKLIL